MNTIEKKLTALQLQPAEGGTFVPVDAQELREIESTLGAPLPAAYRRYLSKHGAATFSGIVRFKAIQPLPPYLSKTGHLEFDEFYGGSDAEESLQSNIRIYRDRMPPNVIPIGGDGSGNHICIGVAGQERGKLFYWDHEHEPQPEGQYREDFGEPRPRTLAFQNLHLIANSFEGFVETLVAEP